MRTSTTNTIGSLAAVIILVVLFIAPGWALGNPIWDEFGGDGEEQVVAQPTETSRVTTPSATAAPQASDQPPLKGTGAQPTRGTTGDLTGAKCPSDHEVKAGESYQVPPGCNVKGDVVVNGQKLYDDDPTTGLIVSCPNGCTIFAPWGANVTPRTVNDLKSEMLASGCGSKCLDVKVVVVDGGTKPPIQITNLCDVSLPKGAKALVPGGCIVSGDVVVNGKALYDSDQTTGLVVIVKAPVEVFAPFGASVTNADPQDVVDAVKQTGCGLPNGCRAVNTITVP